MASAMDQLPSGTASISQPSACSLYPHLEVLESGRRPWQNRRVKSNFSAWPTNSYCPARIFL